MLSGAETQVADGTDERAEEELSQGAEGSDASRTGADGEHEKWQDLNPEEFDPQLRDQVVNLNKAAVTQFQNKVRQLSEQGKLTATERDELKRKFTASQQLFQRWTQDPDQYIAWHKQTYPDYWRNRGGNAGNAGGEGQMTAEDKRALQTLLGALKQEGKIMTQEDVAPLVGLVKDMHGKFEAQAIKESQGEIDAHESWCKENKLPWSEKHCLACIGLIERGQAKSLKEAYSALFEPTFNQANRESLLRKKGSTHLKPSGGQEVKVTNQSLDDIVSAAVRETGA